MSGAPAARGETAVLRPRPRVRPGTPAARARRGTRSRFPSSNRQAAA
ncbi:hypothetical protein STXM2123_285 [Streptomyces sp. F-3]|nr:hypothetical protein STXM2123_285 [Streptomyces sp. F-3]